jgi:single-strand DNA-binding protein
MSSFNKISICGYLGGDTELRHTNTGDPVCDFSVATTER